MKWGGRNGWIIRHGNVKNGVKDGYCKGKTSRRGWIVISAYQAWKREGIYNRNGTGASLFVLYPGGVQIV